MWTSKVEQPFKQQIVDWYNAGGTSYPQRERNVVVKKYHHHASHETVPDDRKNILKRQIRSIQTEGHFGDIKENDNYHCFLHHEIEKYTGKTEQKTAQKKGRPKIRDMKKKQAYPTGSPALKSTEF